MADKESKKEAGVRAPGTTTIAPGVLVTIARLTALSVPGVVDMAVGGGGFLRRSSSEGVRIEVEGGTVSADLYLVLRHDASVREVSQQVQEEVARAIEEMVGMPVSRLDVHIQEISFTSPGAADDE